MLGNRRRAIRYPTDMTVVCRLREGEQEARALNLSKGGLLIQTKEPMLVGDLIEVTLVMPGLETIVLAATVRHAGEGNACGIEFFQLPAREQRRVDAYLDVLDASARASAGRSPSSAAN